MTRPALLLALLATPALAQARAAQFESALSAFVLPTAEDLSLGGLQEEEAVEALLPTLTGDWTSAIALFPARGAFDDATVAASCDRTPTTLAITGPRSFELRRSSVRDGGTVTLAVRHDFLQGNAFDRGASEADLLAFMGLESMPDPSAGMLAFDALRADVAMFHPSPDILVFVAPGQAPEILVRCP